MARASDHVRLSGAFIGALYFIAALLIGLSLLDFIATIWPFVPSDVRWRYGAIGLSSGFLLTPLLGFALAALLANFAGHRRVLVIVGIVALVLGILLILGVLGFGLDAIQVRREASPGGRRVTEISTIKAGFKLTLGALGLLWIGWGSIRQFRSTKTIAKNEEQPPLVLGT
jgi:hypothetical protein